MAYKLDKSGYYVGSSGKKYDAASGWQASNDGKTLTNTYTGQTVSDVASTASKTSNRGATTPAATPANNAVASTGVSPSTTGTVFKTSPRKVSNVSGTTVSNATATLEAAKNIPEMIKMMNGLYQSRQAAAPAAQPATGTPDINWTIRDDNGLVNTANQMAEDNYIPNPAVKELLSQPMPLDYREGVFLEMGDWGRSAPQTAYALDGSTYDIRTAKGLTFLHDAEPGESMVGSDGARFTKNADGSMTVYKDGKTYIYGAGMQTGIFPEEFEYVPFDQTEIGQSLVKDYQDLLNKVQNYDPFSYDPNTDPLYLQYADSYTRGGQRAMTDVIGQLAARTGGMASSYAGSMAQQTYDQYMADLANKIPELQQLAYSMYVDQYNRDVGNFERMYGQFQDAYNRNMQDTQFKYNQYQDELANKWKNLLNTQDMYQQGRQNYNSSQQWDYQKAQDELANKRYEDETAYQREMEQKRFDLEQEQLAWDRDQAQKQAQQDQIDNLWDQVNRYGRIPQLSTVLALGLTYDDYLEMVAQGKHSRAADASRYYSGV